MLLTNKNAVIYGAGGAIGKAVAVAFAKEGGNVFLTGHTKPPLDALANEITAGGVAETAVVDALDEQAIEKHLRELVEKHGSFDVSFNLISIPHFHGVAYVDLSIKDFAEPIKAYATTHFLTATAAARRMVKQGSGVILTIIAPPGHMPVPLTGAFGPSCAMIEGFSRSLAAEVGPSGVRVICLRSSGSPEAPGVQKAFSQHAEATGKSIREFRAEQEKGTLLKRLTSPTEVGNVAAFMASDLASPITAASANISCGSAVD